MVAPTWLFMVAKRVLREFLFSGLLAPSVFVGDPDNISLQSASMMLGRQNNSLELDLVCTGVI